MSPTVNLVIDIGNTLTKVALFKGHNLLHVHRLEEFNEAFFQKLYENFPYSKCIVSCVGKMPQNLETVIGHKTPILHFTSQTPTPLENCYATPLTLGVDRLAAAVGAACLYPNTNVLSVDCGTAITYDIVNTSNQYLGGAITLGVTSRFKALNLLTQKLPLLEPSDACPLVGNSTQTSITSGVINGVICEVDGFIDKIKQLYSPLQIVFTGGETFFFDKKLKNSIFVNPNLVLLGLNRILNYNE